MYWPGMGVEAWATAKNIAVPYAPEMDVMLQKERLDGRAKRIHIMPTAELPDGAFISLDDAAYAVRGDKLLCWSPSGYTETRSRPRGPASVLTPPSIVAVLSAGYRPQWHESASAL